MPDELLLITSIASVMLYIFQRAFISSIYTCTIINIVCIGFFLEPQSARKEELSEMKKQGKNGIVQQRVSDDTGNSCLESSSPSLRPVFPRSLGLSCSQELPATACLRCQYTQKIPEDLARMKIWILKVLHGTLESEFLTTSQMMMPRNCLYTSAVG